MSSSREQKFNFDLFNKVTDGDDDSFRLLDLLKPVNEMINNSEFSNHIDEITTAITLDRNGDKRFTIEDLELLSSDMAAVSKIVKAIVLLIVSSKQVNMKYREGMTEEIIRNVMIYIVLVRIPQLTGRNWSIQEKQKIVELLGKMHAMILASKLTEQLFKKVIEWFQRRNLCMCCIIENDSEDVIEQKLPALNSQIEACINKNRILLSKQMN